MNVSRAGKGPPCQDKGERESYIKKNLKRHLKTRERDDHWGAKKKRRNANAHMTKNGTATRRARAGTGTANFGNLQKWVRTAAKTKKLGWGHTKNTKKERGAV